LFFPQGLTGRSDVGAILFGCVYAFFLSFIARSSG
jgi:hypothetical protein